MAPGRRSRPAWLAAAAAAVVAIGIGTILFRPVATDNGLLRGDQRGAFPDSLVVLDAPPESMRWPVDRGTAGSIALYDDSGRLLWQAPVQAASSFAPDPAQRDAMRPAGTYYWTLTTDDGRELGPYWFRVAE